LSRVTDARRHGVGPTGAFTAHPRRSSMRGQALPIAVGPLLPPPIGRHEQPGGGLALAARHRQRLRPQLCPPMGGHGPPDHCSGAPISDDSELPPAVPRREGLSPTSTVSGAGTGHSRLSRFGATSAAWPEARGALHVRRVLQRRPAWASTRPIRRRLPGRPSCANRGLMRRGP
jgi:hypothetical protein